MLFQYIREARDSMITITNEKDYRPMIICSRITDIASRSGYSLFYSNMAREYVKQKYGTSVADKQSILLHSEKTNNINVSISSKSDISLAKSLICIDEIGNLKENWNQNGAPSFSKEQLETMRKIVYTLDIQPFIAPTAKGTIQFEYENEEGDYLEFELYPDMKIKKFTYTKQGESITEYITIEKVSDIVDSFYR